MPRAGAATYWYGIQYTEDLFLSGCLGLNVIAKHATNIPFLKAHLEGFLEMSIRRTSEAIQLS